MGFRATQSWIQHHHFLVYDLKQINLSELYFLICKMGIKVLTSLLDLTKVIH